MAAARGERFFSVSTLEVLQKLCGVTRIAFVLHAHVSPSSPAQPVLDVVAAAEGNKVLQLALPSPLNKSSDYHEEIDSLLACTSWSWHATRACVRCPKSTDSM